MAKKTKRGSRAVKERRPFSPSVQSSSGDFCFALGIPLRLGGSSSKGERPPRRTRLPSPVGLGASGGAERSRAGLLPLALINDARRLVGKKRPGLRGGPVLAPVPPVRECSRYVPRKKKAKALPKPQTPTLRLSVCSLGDRVVALQHAHTPAAVGQPRLGPRRVGSVPPSVRKMPSLAIRGRGGRTAIVSGAPLSRVGPLTYRLPRPDRPFACSRVPPRARVLWGGTRASSRALSLFPTVARASPLRVRGGSTRLVAVPLLCRCVLERASLGGGVFSWWGTKGSRATRYSSPPSPPALPPGGSPRDPRTEGWFSGSLPGNRTSSPFVGAVPAPAACGPFLPVRPRLCRSSRRGPAVRCRVRVLLVLCVPLSESPRFLLPGSVPTVGELRVTSVPSSGPGDPGLADVDDLSLGCVGLWGATVGRFPCA